jgi:hypothetical protein
MSGVELLHRCYSLSYDCEIQPTLVRCSPFLCRFYAVRRPPAADFEVSHELRVGADSRGTCKRCCYQFHIWCRATGRKENGSICGSQRGYIYVPKNYSGCFPTHQLTPLCDRKLWEHNCHRSPQPFITPTLDSRIKAAMGPE